MNINQQQETGGNISDNLIDTQSKPSLVGVVPPENRATIAWQTKLLPFVLIFFSILLCFAIVGSIWQIHEVQQRIKSPTLVDLQSAFVTPQAPLPSASQSVDLVRWKSLALLEAGLQQKRYDLANSGIMGRLWLTYCGFLTGMCLTFLGAIFVLSKLSERPTNLSLRLPSETSTGGKDGLGWSLESASPGIILVVLGTFVLGLTLFSRNNIEVIDAPAYIVTWNTAEEKGSNLMEDYLNNLPPGKNPTTNPDKANTPVSKAASDR